MEKKMTTSTDFFCRGYPNEFGIFLDYTRTLRFDDKPTTRTFASSSMIISFARAII
jgi:hypothetical protein